MAVGKSQTHYTMPMVTCSNCAMTSKNLTVVKGKPLRTAICPHCECVGTLVNTSAVGAGARLSEDTKPEPERR